MKKYDWFENHEGELGFTVRHTEGDVETIICVTDNAEKAHLITAKLNMRRTVAEKQIEDLEKQLELKRLSTASLLILNGEQKEAIIGYDIMIREFTEEIQSLRKWKEEQLAVTPDMQALAKLMNVPLGETIHDKIIPYIEKLKDQLFPGALLWWIHFNGWHLHSAGDTYYYRSKDPNQWPPLEMKSIEDLKAEFIKLNNL